MSLFRFPYRQGSGGWRYGRDTVGSWILEEPVHFFDMLMWWFAGAGDPASVQAFGNSKGRGAGMYDNFSAVMRWPDGPYALVTQTLAGFEHHHVVEVVGREGSVRTWWSGTMDRTLTPKHELKVQRKGASACEIVELGPSGEVFELEEQLARVVEAFREGRTARLGRGGAQDRRSSASRPSGPSPKGGRSRSGSSQPLASQRLVVQARRRAGRETRRIASAERARERRS